MSSDTTGAAGPSGRDTTTATVTLVPAAPEGALQPGRGALLVTDPAFHLVGDREDLEELIARAVVDATAAGFDYLWFPAPVVQLRRLAALRLVPVGRVYATAGRAGYSLVSRRLTPPS